MITKCKCVHKQQDEIHGVGNRVFNPTEKVTESNREYRCTVCNSTVKGPKTSK